MANAPITLFSRDVEPAAVARLLRESGYPVEIDGPDDAWRNAAVTIGDSKLTFTHDPEYYSEPNWSRQMAGMRGDFSRFPGTDRKARVLMLPTTFRFSLGALFEPDFDPDGDPRLTLLFRVAEALDAVLFTPASLRDARGRVLFGAGGEGEEDPDAVWPRVIGQVPIYDPRGVAMHESSRPGKAEPGEDAKPPSPQRVARRTLALTAVTARAMLEQNDAEDPRTTAFDERFLAWVDALDLADEIEPNEREVIQRPPGKLSQRMQIDSTWRLEGLVVLAWALRRDELPGADELVDANDTWSHLGFMDADSARALMAAPDLRPRQEIRALRDRLFALHWRLRNFRVSPKAMDFAEFPRTCWFGPLDLTGLELIDGDLALGGERLDRASRDAVGSASSAAQERHQAVNWLWEGPRLYSAASVAT